MITNGSLSIFRERLRVFAPVVLGAFGFAFLILWMANTLEGKWMIATLIGIVMTCLAVISRDPAEIFFNLFIFFLALKADIHLTPSASATSGANGFLMNIGDLLLVGLYSS